MKILELLNKHIKVFFIFCLFFSYNAISEDAVDIWEIDPKKITENSNKKKESEDLIEIKGDLKVGKKFLNQTYTSLVLLVLVDRIDFPSPNKKIEKVIPNESFKVIK